jgi:hypothetical protein
MWITLKNVSIAQMLPHKLMWLADNGSIAPILPIEVYLEVLLHCCQNGSIAPH